jgi:hypothetical protein
MKTASRTILFFLLNLYLSTHSFAQIVPSDCTASDSLLKALKKDTYYVTKNIIYKNNLNWKDSLEFPPLLVDSVVKALIAVNHAVTLQARDTVINQLNIHHHPDMLLNRLMIYGDSDVYWMKELRKGHLVTGEPLLDDLISRFGMKLLWYYSEGFQVSWHMVYFSTDDEYNIPAILELIKTIPGVQFAEPEGSIGDGNQITCEFFLDYTSVKYSYQWGDCPSGCTESRTWEFNVYPNCSVEYKGSYGNLLPFTGIREVVQRYWSFPKIST